MESLLCSLTWQECVIFIQNYHLFSYSSSKGVGLWVAVGYNRLPGGGG